MIGWGAKDYSVLPFHPQMFSGTHQGLRHDSQGRQGIGEQGKPHNSEATRHGQMEEPPTGPLPSSTSQRHRED